MRSTIHTQTHTHLCPSDLLLHNANEPTCDKFRAVHKLSGRATAMEWAAAIDGAGWSRERECFTHSRATDRQFSQFMTGNLFRVARSKRADKRGRKQGGGRGTPKYIYQCQSLGWDLAGSIQGWSQLCTDILVDTTRTARKKYANALYPIQPTIKRNNSSLITTSRAL